MKKFTTKDVLKAVKQLKKSQIKTTLRCGCIIYSTEDNKLFYIVYSECTEHGENNVYNEYRNSL